MEEIFNAKESIDDYSEVPDDSITFGLVDPEDYKEAGERIARMYKALYQFYDEHKLSKVQLCDPDGNIIHDPVYDSELTEDGLKLASYTSHWMDLKGAQKIPPNMSWLLKKLQELRENKDA